MNAIADGKDVFPESPHPATHHTIFNEIGMLADEFVKKFNSLNWQHVGNIKKKGK